MKIPKKLKIGGHTYRVTVGDKSDDSSFHDRETMQINIHDRLSQSEKEVALFHEIIHAINCQWKSELVVEFLAQSLYQVLKDNKLIK